MIVRLDCINFEIALEVWSGVTLRILHLPVHEIDANSLGMDMCLPLTVSICSKSSVFVFTIVREI